MMTEADDMAMATTHFQSPFSPMTDHIVYPAMKICTYNIMHGGNARLEAAMRTMRHMNMDLGILTETKLVKDFHTTRCEGYEIVSTKAKSKHQGGVVLFYQQSTKWHIEGTKTFGPNVIRTELISGTKRWTIVGAYIPPSETDGTTLEWIQKATSTLEHPLILLGDLNVNIYQSPAGDYNERQEDTKTLIASLGLTDLRRHFTQRQGWKEWTWSHRKGDQRDRNICDYILVQERNSFRNFQIKHPRFDSDHRLIQASLSLQPEKEHKKYVSNMRGCANELLPKI